MGNKKGLNTKVITVFNPDNDEDFELFVTYEILESDLVDDEETFYDITGDVDIKSYNTNGEEDVPDWVTEDLVYETLLTELEVGEDDDETVVEDDYYNDYDSTYNDDFSDNDDDY
jgi:hypothetical protein